MTKEKILLLVKVSARKETGKFLCKKADSEAEKNEDAQSERKLLILLLTTTRHHQLIKLAHLIVDVQKRAKEGK